MFEMLWVAYSCSCELILFLLTQKSLVVHAMWGPNFESLDLYSSGKNKRNVAEVLTKHRLQLVARAVVLAGLR